MFLVAKKIKSLQIIQVHQQRNDYLNCALITKKVNNSTRNYFAAAICYNVCGYQCISKAYYTTAEIIYDDSDDEAE